MEIEEGLNRFDQLTRKPENFLGVQTQIGQDLKHLLKDLYDFTKCSEDQTSRSIANGGLPQLVIKHFDEEQIWQELELQNDNKCNGFITDVSLLVARKDNLTFGVKENSHTIEATSEFNISDDSRSSDDDNESNSPEMDGEENGGREDAKGLVEKRRRKGKVKSKPSIVDDQFFKLKELENYLETEDRKENRRQKNKSSVKRNKDDDEEEEEEEDDESIDYFEDIPSEVEEEEEGGNADAYYKDFFDPPDMEDNVEEVKDRMDGLGDEDLGSNEDDEEENDDVETHHKVKKQGEKQVRFNMSPASSGSESSESEDNKKKEGNKSSFEARQERVKSRIEQFEEEALAEKPWQLKGEISAAARPQNSLLEEIVEFDLTMRPAPVITEQTTMKLEDIIRQRIKDKVWDDVERKVKPVKAPDEYKKKLVMDQEKSKLSLAEVYEQEYIKQREAQDPANKEKPEEEPKEHQEIRAMMSSLFTKLDALSNFHYTPKPVVPEIKVISNIPAINMEEVAPIATSDATLLAPEEVKAKPKGDVIGKAERTKTDKKRERRHKKAMQRQRWREKEKREKVVEKIRPGLGNKYTKERALQMLEKVTKEKNVEQMADLGKDKGVRSSTAFFARLQDEVTSHIKVRTDTNKGKKIKNVISAKKVKL